MLTTATTTHTATIHRTSPQQIKDVHRHLRNVWIALRALTDNRQLLRHHRKRLITLLDELRDQLAMHFALEEAAGYFDDAIDDAPRLTENADRLRDEHAYLYATLADIANDAEDAYADGLPAEQLNNLVKRLGEFDAKLNEHETKEAQLILEALDRDIGGEG